MKIATPVRSERKLGLTFSTKQEIDKYEIRSADNSIFIVENIQDEDKAMGHDDVVEYFQRRMPSSESRDDEDEGFSEYDSLYFFNLPRPEAPTDIVIAVQAVTISSKQDKCNGQVDNVTLDMTSGFAIVGIVREIGTQSEGIEVGDRVASILQTLSNNPRYATFPADLAVKVPCGVDSAEAASCAYTHFRAFQSLNHGIPFNQRYARKPLTGKKVLVVDGTGVIGQATIELAINAGAQEVYAVGQECHHQSLKLSGAIPLRPTDWADEVQHRMDLVIDSVQAVHHQQFLARKTLKPDGKIVCVGTPVSSKILQSKRISSTLKPLVDDFIAQLDLVFIQKQNATFYNLFSDIEHYPNIMKADLQVVLYLLAEGLIQPKIMKYINTDELAYGYLSINTNKMIGTIIFEPWNKRGPPKCFKNSNKYSSIT